MIRTGVSSLRSWGVMIDDVDDAGKSCLGEDTHSHSIDMCLLIGGERDKSAVKSRTDSRVELWESIAPYLSTLQSSSTLFCCWLVRCCTRTVLELSQTLPNRSTVCSSFSPLFHHLRFYLRMYILCNWARIFVCLQSENWVLVPLAS